MADSRRVNTLLTKNKRVYTLDSRAKSYLIHESKEVKTTLDQLDAAAAKKEVGKWAVVVTMFATESIVVPVVKLHFTREGDEGQGYQSSAVADYVYHKTKGWITPEQEALVEYIRKGEVTTFTHEQLLELLCARLPRQNLQIKDMIAPKGHEKEAKTELSQYKSKYDKKLDDKNLEYSEKAKIQLAFEAKMALENAKKSTQVPAQMRENKDRVARLLEHFKPLVKEPFFSFWSSEKSQQVKRNISRILFDFEEIDYKKTDDANNRIQKAIQDIYKASLKLSGDDPLGKSIDSFFRQHFPREFDLAVKAVTAELKARPKGPS